MVEQDESALSVGKRLSTPATHIGELARPKSSRIALKWNKLTAGRPNLFSIQAENKMRKYGTTGIRSQLNYGSTNNPASRSPDSEQC